MSAVLFVTVAVGGALGAVLRYLVSVAFAGRGPLAVLIVNVAGSLVSGVTLAAIDDPWWSLVIVTGFCGGLTTFSTLGVDTVQLILQRRARRAMLFVVANLVLGLVAVVAGLALGGAVLAGSAAG